MAQNQHIPAGTSAPAADSAAVLPLGTSQETAASTGTLSGTTAGTRSPALPVSPADAGSPHAMDGSQFHNVIEEQTWSELPPTAEEQQPRRARHLDDADRDATPPPEQPQISVGTA